jgi:hypothetical protein
VIHRLVARGVLEWQQQRHRTVLARPALAAVPAPRRVTRQAAAPVSMPSDRGPHGPRP